MNARTADDIATLHEQLDQALTRAEAAEAELRELRSAASRMACFGHYARWLLREVGLLPGVAGGEPLLLPAVDELLAVDRDVDESAWRPCVERALQHLRTARGMVSEVRRG